MLFSCAAAFVMPFEVFLFAYAILGPLHYLTEISWLHDRNYFSKGKYDYIVLLVIGVLITLQYFASRFHFWPYDSNDNEEIAKKFDNLGDTLILLALLGGFIMAFVKSMPVKIISLFLAFLIANQAFAIDENGERNNSMFLYIITAFVPTLIHVYVFTGFFMLFGALKSRSRSGLWSIVVFILCPILLITLFRDTNFISVTSYGVKAYGGPNSPDGFFNLNQSILGRFFNPSHLVKHIPGVDISKADDNTLWNALVYRSQTGILIMRFIAFAYTYHYLNWFSKTEVIRWHKIPKARFIAVIVLWIISITIYTIDYSKGLLWLFFLSFCHVLLEFPLNFTSIVGIGKETGNILKNGFKPKVALARK